MKKRKISKNDIEKYIYIDFWSQKKKIYKTERGAGIGTTIKVEYRNMYLVLYVKLLEWMSIKGVTINTVRTVPKSNLKIR
jgi:hypothetical protein